MSQPFKLYRLQQLDTQLDHDGARSTEIQAALADDSIMLKQKEEADLATKAHQQVQKSLRLAEENVINQRIKIEQTESALYGGKVRNPKELQDLQREAESLKRYLVVLEEEELNHMIQEEEARDIAAKAASEVKQLQVKTDVLHAGLHDEYNHIQRDITHLEDERRATASTIPQEELALYEQLRKKKGGVAVALVKDKFCSACGSALNATLLHNARLVNQIVRCETCGRILYAG